ncbi:MAG: aldose 1-epimerase [Rhizorhabdus sp.]|nr:aldose 1-epimerase [Rhizorhabdus sp.]
MSGTVTIGSDRLRAEIAPLGAELQRLTDADGRELLWDGDPAFWASRAPILFPIVGTLRDDRFLHEGRTYSLPRHGFARRREFAVVAQSADSVTFRLDSDDATRAVWPFDIRLDMRFTIAGAAIEMRAIVTNLSDAAMPTSFGFHPALRWPLPGGGRREDHAIVFDRPEPEPIRRLDPDGLIDAVPLPSPVDGRRLALSDELFAYDALIFDRPASRRLVYGVEGTTQIAVDYEGMPALGLWSKPGAGFVCIEPWQGYADPADASGDIADKPGTISIAAGETRDFAMTISIL